LQQPVNENGRERERDNETVKSQVLKQPPHQPRVVRFAKDFFFVEAVCHCPQL
jgi:hypothetical protein